jgi:hypothetical protein
MIIFREKITIKINKLFKVTKMTKLKIIKKKKK